MHIPKRYGQSRVDMCPFCRKHATSMNSQKVPVCQSHKKETLGDLKCACGSTLDMLHGKFGVFFSCMKCGNMNLKKVMELNAIKPAAGDFKGDGTTQNSRQAGKIMITVRSDDPRYFD
ncbi:hypothetical protein HYS31_04735 [Candidatus Woesearchaeota archaeon]|nr:hypothetical protein [Candidatus Woesearchaeota archaeon]